MKHKSVIYIYLKEIVYGGSDGIITTFAVVAGFSGANSSLNTLPYYLVLLFGLANLFADASSMGIGNFLSERSDASKNKTKNKKAYLKSIATASSFIIFGLIPLSPYFLNQNSGTFFYSILATLLALILLGILRGKTTGEKLQTSVKEVVLLGSISALVAYFVGTFFKV